MIPRIRGRSGMAAEGPHKGKWFYEISLWDLAGENQFGDPFQLGPFDTEEKAFEVGRGAVKDISQDLEKKGTGEVSGKYFDLKNGGIMRPWESHS